MASRRSNRRTRIDLLGTSDFGLRLQLWIAASAYGGEDLPGREFRLDDLLGVGLGWYILGDLAPGRRHDDLLWSERNSRGDLTWPKDLQCHGVGLGSTPSIVISGRRAGK